VQRTLEGSGGQVLVGAVSLQRLVAAFQREGVVVKVEGTDVTVPQLSAAVRVMDRYCKVFVNGSGPSMQAAMKFLTEMILAEVQSL
jgi:hypothetical protein